MAGATLVRANVTHNLGVQKFEEDLKKAVLAAGVDAKHVVFLLKDAQVCTTTWPTCSVWIIRYNVATWGHVTP